MEVRCNVKVIQAIRWAREDLTPGPSPMGRGEMDSLSLRERARVRDNCIGVKVPGRGDLFGGLKPCRNP